MKFIARRFAPFLAFAAIMGRSQRARADEPTVSPIRSTFALVVTTNRSAKLGRPDLRYADDDGAKYYEMFRMVAPKENVALHTTFDRDTARLFPTLVPVTKAPSRQEVARAIDRIAKDVDEAKKKGPVDFYFVFAGHGDVDHGKGFLELEDGPFTSDDLDGMVKTVSATRIHVVLDSCNSFFVVNARKPGGRHFTTSEDAAKSLSERWSNVGVFLSTSAEAEVYEWSELQSGIFSHAVRSGFSGAADANGDGHVSYDELRAFVSIASKGVKNPNFRPQVYARGPGGTGGTALFESGSATGVKVRLDGAERRLTLRDNDEVPWIDLHKEAGRSLDLTVPARVAHGSTLEETPRGATRPATRHALPEEAPELVAFADLKASPVATDARGPDDMFRNLYAQPYGPEAYATFQREWAAQPPLVYGVSSDDVQRMGDLLEQAAEHRRTQRLVGGAAFLGLGVFTAGAGGSLLALQDRTANPRTASQAGQVLLGVGAGFAATGAVIALVPSAEEDLHEYYTERMKISRDPMRTMLLSETRLNEIAATHRTQRYILRGAGIAVAGAGLVGGGIGIAAGRRPEDRFISGLVGGAGILYGAMFVGMSTILDPTERLAELWSRDPSVQRMPRTTGGLRVRPEIGLGSLGLSGTF